MPSFDIESKIDSHELTNAVDQSNRVISNRFDFKSADAIYEIKENNIVIGSVGISGDKGENDEKICIEAVKKNGLDTD